MNAGKGKEAMKEGLAWDPGRTESEPTSLPWSVIQVLRSSTLVRDPSQCVAGRSVSSGRSTFVSSSPGFLFSLNGAGAEFYSLFPSDNL